MIGREEGGSLVVRDVASRLEHRLPLDGLSPRYVRIDPAGALVAISAIEPGGHGPTLAGGGSRGEGRLFVSPLAEPGWRRLDDGLAIDPAWFASSDRVAFATGSGPAVAELASGKVRRRRGANYAWGPTAISASPAGSRVAFLKRQGDGSRLAVWDLRTDAVTPGPGCASYCWFDDDRILFQLGGEPKLLDVSTGRTSRWASIARLGELARSVAPEGLAPVPASWATWEAVAGIVDLPARLGDRVYFVAGYERRVEAPGLASAGGLFSVTPSLDAPELHAWWEGDPPDTYEVLAGGELFWAGWNARWNTKAPRRTAYVGRASAGLDASWWPLPRNPRPEFGDPILG